jgi:hypothetical protein
MSYLQVALLGRKDDFWCRNDIVGEIIEGLHPVKLDLTRCDFGDIAEFLCRWCISSFQDPGYRYRGVSWKT